MRSTVRCLLVATSLAVARVLAGSPPAPAEAPQLPSPLTLRACYDLAIAHNPEIRAAALGAEADRARITQAKGAFDPAFFTETSDQTVREPVAGDDTAVSARRDTAWSAGISKRFVTGTEVELASSVDYSDDRDPAASFDPSVDTGGSLLLRQDLLRDAWIGVNRTGIRQAEDTWRASVEGIRNSLISNLFEVEQAYWNLYFAAADLRVREEQLSRANRLVAVSEAQVRVGESAPIDITRARSSAASQTVSIASARSRIAVLRHRLLRLLGALTPDTANGALTLADEPPAATETFELDTSLETAYAQRPDCRQAMIGLSQAERQQAYTFNQVLPSLRLYGGVELRGLDTDIEDSRHEAATGDFDTWVAGVRLEVPIGNRAAMGAYRAAQMERRRAAAHRRAVLQQATNEVADAFEDLLTTAQQIDTTRQSRALAQDLLQAEEKSFRLGRSSSLDVLSAQQALAAAEREEIRARVTYATALSYLLVTRGDFLERKGIPAECLSGLAAGPGE